MNKMRRMEREILINILFLLHIVLCIRMDINFHLNIDRKVAQREKNGKSEQKKSAFWEVRRIVNHVKQAEHFVGTSLNIVKKSHKFIRKKTECTTNGDRLLKHLHKILFFTLSRTNDEIKLLGSMKNDNLFAICEFRTCSIDRESVVWGRWVIRFSWSHVSRAVKHRVFFFLFLF